MAIGDVISGGITNQAFQPAIGVDILITTFISEASSARQLEVKEGTQSGGIEGVFLHVIRTTAHPQDKDSTVIRLPINNGFYINNPHPAAAHYQGIQTK